MKRVIELGVVIGALLAGCATDEDASGMSGDTADPVQDPGAADPAASEPVVGSDAAATGAPTTRGSTAALPAPSTASAGSSTLAMIAAAASGGTGVQIHGGSEDGAFALASYQLPATGARATAQFTVNASPGAAFVYILIGSGSGYSTRKLQLERVPGSHQLQATTTTGQVMCGAIGDAPTAVTLVFDTPTQTFDVRIAGAATACTGLHTHMKGPAIGFNLMDASNPGYGGDVAFTHLALF